MDEIKALAKTLIVPIFNLDETPKKYSILYKCRNNESIRREDILHYITGLINRSNQVALKDFDWAIIVEIIKKTCFMSIVSDYRRYKKFNITAVNK